MKQIVLYSMKYLHNDEHDQLQTEFEKLIETETSDKLGITIPYNQYKTARTNEKTALQNEQGSVHTKSINDADGYRDDLDYGFSLFVESHLHHFDPEIQEKARRIKRILDSYGNIRKANYNSESSGITNRNAEINNNYNEELNALGNGWAAEWLSKLSEANSQFIAHFGDRANEQATRSDITVLDARAEVDNCWKEIATKINALVVVNGEDTYSAFIDQVNYYINYYKNIVAARKGRKTDTVATSDTQAQ